MLALCACARVCGKEFELLTLAQSFIAIVVAMILSGNDGISWYKLGLKHTLGFFRSFVKIVAGVVDSPFFMNLLSEPLLLPLTSTLAFFSHPRCLIFYVFRRP